MQHNVHHTTTDHAHAHAHDGAKEVKRVTIILTVITLVELAFGYWIYAAKLDGFFASFLKGAILILMLAKAFYIVAYFMHLKHELRNMIMTIVVPLGLFIWFIIAFLHDGNAFKNAHMEYDAYKKERTTKQAPAPSHDSHKNTNEEQQPKQH